MEAHFIVTFYCVYPRCYQLSNRLMPIENHICTFLYIIQRELINHIIESFLVYQNLDTGHKKTLILWYMSYSLDAKLFYLTGGNLRFCNIIYWVDVMEWVAQQNRDIIRNSYIRKNPFVDLICICCAKFKCLKLLELSKLKMLCAWSLKFTS